MPLSNQTGMNKPLPIRYLRRVWGGMLLSGPHSFIRDGGLFAFAEAAVLSGSELVVSTAVGCPDPRLSKQADSCGLASAGESRILVCKLLDSQAPQPVFRRDRFLCIQSATAAAESNQKQVHK